MTSGTILRISRAVSRAWLRVIVLLLVTLIVMGAKCFNLSRVKAEGQFGAAPRRQPAHEFPSWVSLALVMAAVASHAVSVRPHLTSGSSRRARTRCDFLDTANAAVYHAASPTTNKE